MTNATCVYGIFSPLFFNFNWVCKLVYLVTVPPHTQPFYSSLVPVPSQDKLAGLCQEGHPALKWWGWQWRGQQLAWVIWQSKWIVGVSASVIFILHQKIQKMANKHTTCGNHPVGIPTCPQKQEVGKPLWNIAQHCARVQGYINDDLRADGLRKGRGFRVGTWNVDSLTRRADEVVEALSDRKVDVVCIQDVAKRHHSIFNSGQRPWCSNRQSADYV